jgi:hypothetical protein
MYILREKQFIKEDKEDAEEKGEGKMQECFGQTHGE